MVSFDSRTGFTDDELGDHPTDTVVSGYEYGSLTRGLTAYWPLDGTTTDVVGTNDLTLENGATFAGSGQVGSDSLVLDGVDDAAVTPHGPGLSPPYLTVAAWVYPLSFTEFTRVVAKDGSQQAYQFMIRDTGAPAFRVNLNGGWYGDGAFSPTIPTGQWTHVAGTYDGSTVVGYIDGSPIPLDSVSGTLNTDTGPLALGRRSDQFQDRFEGQIDDVRIYGRALSSGEISELMTRTSPSSAPTTEDRLR